MEKECFLFHRDWFELTHGKKPPRNLMILNTIVEYGLNAPKTFFIPRDCTKIVKKVQDDIKRDNRYFDAICAEWDAAKREYTEIDVWNEVKLRQGW